MTKVLKGSLWWLLEKPTQKEQFCLDLLCGYLKLLLCSKTSFEWMSNFTVVIKSVGEIYCAYHAQHKHSKDPIIQDAFLQSVRANSGVAAYSLIKWIQGIQVVLASWQRNTQADDVTLNDLSFYIEKTELVQKLATSVAAEHLVVSLSDLNEKKRLYHDNGNELNSLLLKQSTQHGEVYVNNELLLLQYILITLILQVFHNFHFS